MTKLYTVTTVSDNCDKFTQSSCTCAHCTSMHLSATEWTSFVPKNKLQSRMIKVINKLENDEKNRQRKKKAKLT